MLALHENTNVATSMALRGNIPTGDQKSRKSAKRVLDNDPVEQDTENHKLDSSSHPPSPKRRSRKLQSPTIVIGPSRSPVNGNLLASNVDNGPPQPKRKPGPKAGFKYPTEAESPPPWSWDVTGEWTLTSPQLVRVLDLEEPATLAMTIRLANNPRHTKEGRQLWATFDFGDGALAGNIRFCPDVESNEREGVDIKDFEKACVLKRGQWVGPRPNGLPKWNLRWRGIDVDSGVVEQGSDQYQTEIEFEKGGDGKLTLVGVLVFQFQPIVFRGIKIKEGKPPKGNDTTVDRRWLQYKPRYL
jgi:hypothetical protein